MSGSATYPVLGTKLPDCRFNGSGEMLYTRGGAVAKGDIMLINPFTTDAAVDSTKYAGTPDAWTANVTPVETTNHTMALSVGKFRVANAAIADDAQGPYLGERRCIAIVRVSAGGPSTWSAGTELIAVSGQPYLALASTGVGGEKIVAKLTKDQAVVLSGGNMLEVEFDGENGHGQKPTVDT